MTTPPTPLTGRNGRRGGAAPPRRPAAVRPPDGVLLRLVVDGPDWSRHIPPVPHRHDVTVAFSAITAADLHADALEAAGYRLVGLQPLSASGTGVEVADFLVPQVLLEAHPDWWRALAAQADRAFSLAMGPVLASLGAVLRTHLPPPPPPSA